MIDQDRDPIRRLGESASTPLKNVSSGSVAHARELSDETLRSLMEFCEVLERLCTGVAEISTDPSFYSEFSSLIDGISTFTEGVSCVKRALKLEKGAIPILDSLETQLISILKGLLTHQENRDPTSISEIIKADLKENLQNWRQVALPVLIRSRDC